MVIPPPPLPPTLVKKKEDPSIFFFIALVPAYARRKKKAYAHPIIYIGLRFFQVALAKATRKPAQKKSEALFCFFPLIYTGTALADKL